MVGWINFTETPNVSDVQGRLTRFSPNQIEGEELTVSGSSHKVVAGSWPLDQLTASNGVATLTFSSGGLSAPLEQNITISKVISIRKKLSVICTLPTSNTNALTLVIDPLTGNFLGRFRATPTSPFINYSGVLFQKQNLGEGRFENAGQIGSVTLLPAVQ